MTGEMVHHTAVPFDDAGSFEFTITPLLIRTAMFILVG